MAVELLPGFRFYPTEEELVSFYLAKKLQTSGGGDDDHINHELNKLIPVLDIYNKEPWDLPQFCGEICHRETDQWFFFTPQQEKEARGGRTSRSTLCGYWKATGSPSVVYSTTQKKAIGVKKTMVFYEGKTPMGKKTKWKMNEYKAINEETTLAGTAAASSSSGNALILPELRHEMSLCRVYVTSRDARAFDRRPPPTTVNNNIIMTEGSSGEFTSIQEDKDHGQATGTGPSSLKRERSCSTERSYSGGDQHPADHGTTGNSSNGYNDRGTEMMDSLESLWDWERLNWAYN